ncbi:hypothetical protein YC2023_066260 [Brassica napus]
MCIVCSVHTDVRGCPQAHTGRPWLSVAVLQHTQDVRGCPTHISTLVLGLSTLALPVDCLGDFGPGGLSVMYTQDVCGTHRTSVAVNQYTISTLVLGLRTLALPVDYSGDFGQRGLSIQYTHDIYGCPSAHTGRPWVSVSTHRTSVAVCVCPCVSVSTHRLSVAVHQYTYQNHTQDIRGWLCVSVSTHRTSVAVYPYTYQHAGPWSEHAGLSRGLFGTHKTFVGVRQHTQAVRVCPSAHTGRLWLFLSTHISTLVLGLSTLTLPVDCFGDFGPHGLSVQYTQDVCGCPPAHTGRPWVSVAVRQHTQDIRGCLCVSVCVRVCLSAHTGRPWVSVRTHRTSVCVCQQTQDICGCPCVSVSTNMTSVAVHQYTYQHVVHTGRLWVSASTHMTSVAVRQHTQDVHGCMRVSVCVCQQTQDVCGCPSVHISARCSVHTGRSWVSISAHRTSVCVCQHTQDVRVCLSAHTGRPCVFVSTHRTGAAVNHTHSTSVGVRQHTQDVIGCSWLSVSIHRTSVAVRMCPCVSVNTHKTSVAVHHTHRTSVGVRQHTQDVRGCLPAHTGRPWLSVCVCVCPSAHTGRPWLSISTHISTLVLGLSTLALPVDYSGDFGPRGLSVQYTQDVRGCLPVHTRRPWLSVSTHRTSVAVRMCLCVSVSTHRTSVAVHQYTYQHVAPWTQHADPSRGLFGLFWPTWAVCSVHTGHPWVSGSTHTTSVCVHQHTQDVRGCLYVSVCVRQHTQDVSGCPSVHISARWSLDSARWPFPWTVWVILARLSVQYTQDVRGCLPAHTRRQRLSGAVRQHTHDVCRCPYVSMCVRQHTQAVRVCPSAHTGRLWLFLSTHISTLVLGLSTLTLPVDCFGDFGPRGLSVQYTQDVCGCPPAHTGRPWLSVAVRQHTQDIRGCLCVSVCVRVCLSAHTGRPWVSVRTHRTSVCVCQQTQDICGCPCVSVSTNMASVAVHQYTYQHVVHTGRLWVSASTHMTSVAVRQHTQDVHGFQYTQDVRGCPSAHTGRPCVSVSTHRTFVGVRQHTQDVRVCLSAHTGRVRLSISTHISTTHRTSVGVRQHTQDVLGCSWLSVSIHRTSVAVRMCPCVSVNTHRTSVAVHHTQRTSVGVRQHTQDVRGCLPAHTGRPWLSVCVCVCPSAHTGRPWLSISTHISTLVLGLSTLALPVDYSGDFGPRGLSVQYTQDVRGCLPVHTRRPWLSVSTHRTSVAVRMCLCVSVSTHRTSVAVHQYTYQHVAPWTQHADPSRGLFGLFWPTWAVCSVHTGHPWVSGSTHTTSVCVRQHTQDVRGCLYVSVCVRQHTQDVSGCPSVHISARCTHRTSVGVCQHTQDVSGCPGLSVSTHMTSVAVRMCPCVSVNTHRTSVAVHQYTYQTLVLGLSTLVLGLSMLAFPMDCSGNFGQPGLSVQYTQDVCGCPSAHTGRPWSISTHISTLVLGLSTLTLPVDCSGYSGPRGLSVQYTQDVRGCPSAHTRRPCVSVSTHRTSVAVHVCSCVSVSTLRTSVAVHQYTYQHAVHTGRLWVSASTHRTAVAVCGCPSAHTGHPWLSVRVRVCPCVSVSTHRTSVGVRPHTQDVRVCLSADTGHLWLSMCVRKHKHDIRGCPSVHISALHTGRLWVSASTHMTSVAVRQHTQDVHGCMRVSLCVRQHTQDVCGCPSVHISARCTHRTSVGVRQHTQDVRGCLLAHTGRQWLSVCVCVCPSAHTGRPWLSISTHISTLVLGLSTLALPVDYSGDFGPRGLSVQYTQDVRGCLPVHTRRPWLSGAVRQHTQDVCRCPTLTLPVDCSGYFGPRGLSVQYTQDIRGCPAAYTRRPCVAVSTHRTSVAVCVCPCVSVSTHRTSVAVHHTHRTSVGVCQHTQDVSGCPGLSISTHMTSVAVRMCPCVSVSTHRTSVAVHQYTYQTLVLGLSMLAFPMDCSGDFGQPGLSVQYTQDVCGCPSAHTGRPWVTHISTLVLGLSTLTLPMDCSGYFGPRGLSVQYTQDVRGCPSAHTRRPCVSVSTHRTSVAVRVCSCVSISTFRTSVAVHQYTYQHVGPWTQHADPSRGLFRLFWPTWAVFSVHTGRPWVSVSTHTTSVCVRQHTL